MVLKTDNKLRKIRIMVKPINLSPTYGVILPIQLMKRWEGVFVKVSESGNSLILESGALPTPLTKKQINVHSKKLEVIEI